MRILIVTHYFHPHIGGIEIVAYNQAKELVKRGHEVTIVTSKLGNEKSLDIISGIRVIRIKAYNVLEKYLDVPYPFFSPAIIPQLRKEIKRSDLVHVHGALYLGSFFSALFAKIYQRPLITMDHVGFVPYTSGILNAIQFLAFHSIGKLTLNLSCNILVINKHTQRYIQKIAQSSVTIVPNGVDVQLFHPVPLKKKVFLRKKYNLPLHRKIILYVGRFVQKKNIHLILLAKDSTFDIALVGTGQLPKIQRANGIHIFRNLHQEHVAELYQTCDIFVHTSIGEELTLSIREAMASGLPVITTSIPSGASIIKTHTITYIQPTARRVSQAVKRLLTHKTMRETMGRVGRSIAEKEFSWQKNVDALLSVYKKELFHYKTH